MRIAERHEFVDELEGALAETSSARRAAADAFLARTSWDHTFRRMSALLRETARAKGQDAFSTI